MGIELRGKKRKSKIILRSFLVGKVRYFEKVKYFEKFEYFQKFSEYFEKVENILQKVRIFWAEKEGFRRVRATLAYFSVGGVSAKKGTRHI